MYFKFESDKKLWQEHNDNQRKNAAARLADIAKKRAARKKAK